MSQYRFNVLPAIEINLFSDSWTVTFRWAFFYIYFVHEETK